ncbi:uncharacterized serine-rich protein C215.13-like [Gigantopelta aegis]|uniref:uncharacterized serine-rich protein C215.13-like n=1 Tax=Gigantopelta aegis TaxID=1735272 RepID=UPI001B888B10|nr:uncharacterized serine-rich protein C215.13-like [Gigantopelta aegis]
MYEYERLKDTELTRVADVYGVQIRNKQHEVSTLTSSTKSGKIFNSAKTTRGSTRTGKHAPEDRVLKITSKEGNYLPFDLKVEVKDGSAEQMKSSKITGSTKHPETGHRFSVPQSQSYNGQVTSSSSSSSSSSSAIPKVQVTNNDLEPTIVINSEAIWHESPISHPTYNTLTTRDGAAVGEIRSGSNNIRHSSVNLERLTKISSTVISKTGGLRTSFLPISFMTTKAPITRGDSMQGGRNPEAKYTYPNSSARQNSSNKVALPWLTKAGPLKTSRLAIFFRTSTENPDESNTRDRFTRTSNVNPRASLTTVTTTSQDEHVSDLTTGSSNLHWNSAVHESLNSIGLTPTTAAGPSEISESSDSPSSFRTNNPAAPTRPSISQWLNSPTTGNGNSTMSHKSTAASNQRQQTAHFIGFATLKSPTTGDGRSTISHIRTLASIHRQRVAHVTSYTTLNSPTTGDAKSTTRPSVSQWLNSPTTGDGMSTISHGNTPASNQRQWTAPVTAYKAVLDETASHHPTYDDFLFTRGGPADSDDRRRPSYVYQRATPVTEELATRHVVNTTLKLLATATDHAKLKELLTPELGNSMRNDEHRSEPPSYQVLSTDSTEEKFKDLKTLGPSSERDDEFVLYPTDETLVTGSDQRKLTNGPAPRTAPESGNVRELERNRLMLGLEPFSQPDLNTSMFYFVTIISVACFIAVLLFGTFCYVCSAE